MDYPLTPQRINQGDNLIAIPYTSLDEHHRRAEEILKIKKLLFAGGTAFLVCFSHPII
jgi:hypothetical protein